MIAVCNTTPLVNLAAIGQFDLLRRRHEIVYVPGAVYREGTEAGAGRPGDTETRVAEWIGRRSVTDSALTRQLHGVLDPGEVEAVALYVELGADRLLIDELRGRKGARAMGDRVTGIVGLLIQAKQKRYIPALKPHLDALRAGNFWMSDALYGEALRAVGEEES